MSEDKYADDNLTVRMRVFGIMDRESKANYTDYWIHPEAADTVLAYIRDRAQMLVFPHKNCRVSDLERLSTTVLFLNQIAKIEFTPALHIPPA